MAWPYPYILSLIFIFYTPLALGSSEQPQKLPKETISVGSKKISVEIARTPNQLATGLMYRKSLDSDSGMLFIFESERPLSFWMKNTFIPLSIGFFSADKKLLEVLEMEPVGSVMQLDIPRYQSSKPAQYALEMTKGWFSKNKIKVGTRLKLPSN